MSIISLDWRKPVDSAHLLNEIHKVLTAQDVDGFYPVELSSSDAASATALETVNGVPMIVRHQTAKNKRMNNQPMYFARFLVVGYKFIEMISYQEPRKMRKLQYLLTGEEMNGEMVKKLAYDWALTLKVHPCSLGLLHENPGRVNLPTGIKIRATIVTDVFRWTQESRTLAGAEAIIPGMILRMHSVITAGTSARAVVVVEHRNVDLSSSNIAEQLKGVIVVATAGYPSLMTREFLHLLAEDVKFKKVPFLFFSDHDFHGFQIFLTLKYGAKATAWASATQVCAKLQWIGPSVKDVYGTISKHTEVYKAEKMAEPSVTEEDASKLTRIWERRMGEKIERALHQKITMVDKSLMRGMEKSGMLEKEEELAEEMRQMAKTGSKFGLSRLSFVRPNGMELFMVERTQDLAPQSVKIPVAVTTAKVSQRAAEFNRLPSQINSDMVMSGALPVEETAQPGTQDVADEFDTTI
ncbi:Meiotic recombination protein W68 [Hypocenomyce scalaris]|nr:Meiotic recombination protein W68 [Hypocenomyce scalaris]